MNKRRKGRMSVIMPWLKRFGLGVCLVTGLSWLFAWLWLSGSITRAGDWTESKLIEIASAGGFTVENILVEGRVHSDPELLRAIVNVNKGDPLFAFDPAEAKAMIEEISWVKQAHVERRLPDTIYIGIEERKPVALFQAEQALSLIDEEGAVITSENLGRFRELVIVMGEGAPQHAAEMLEYLRAEPEIYNRTVAAKWMSGRRWDLDLKSGIVVKLPEQDLGLALRRLADAQVQDSLLEKDVVNIDLRDPGNLVVRTKPGAVHQYIKAGSNI